jgi:transposase-like protein
MSDESHWRVMQVEAAEAGTVTVHADYAALSVSCPRCGSQRRPSRHGALPATYRDTPFLGRRVSIAVDVQRFRCPDCKQAFLQDLPDMDSKRRITARCAGYVIDQVMARSSMGEVARIVGVDEKTIRNVLDDRSLIFSVGDPPSSDRFVCESCIGIHQKADHRLASAKHFGRWRSGDLQLEANVCKDCFDFARDPWRAGVVRRIRGSVLT